MELDAVCLRCEKWFTGGEGCPGCDRDPDSVYCDPPDWAVQEESSDSDPDGNVT